MHQLILTLMAIALSAATLFTTVSYVNPSMAVSQDASAKVYSGVLDLETAWGDYYTANSAYLPTANWRNVLTPAYTFMPRTPTNTQWNYGHSTGYYFCLSPVGNAAVVTQAQYTGLLLFMQKVSSQQAFIGQTGCGATVNGARPSTWPAKVYLTYWVSPY